MASVASGEAENVQNLSLPQVKDLACRSLVQAGRNMFLCEISPLPGRAFVSAPLRVGAVARPMVLYKPPYAGIDYAQLLS